MPEKKKKKVLRPGSKRAVHAAAKKPKKGAKKTAKKATKRAAKAKRSVKASSVTEAHVSKAGNISVYDLNAKSVDTIHLDPIFQGTEINSDVIYQTVLMYQAGEREGTASTKDRGHVRG